MEEEDRGGKRQRVSDDFDMDALRGAGIRGADVVPMKIDDFEAAQAKELERRRCAVRRAAVEAAKQAAQKRATEEAMKRGAEAVAVMKAKRAQATAARAKLAAEIKKRSRPDGSAFAALGYKTVPPTDTLTTVKGEIDMLGLEVGPLPYADGTLIASKRDGFSQLFAIVGSGDVQVTNKQLRAVPVPDDWTATDGEFHTIVVDNIDRIVVALLMCDCAEHTLLHMDDVVVMRRSTDHTERAHAALRGDLVGERAAYWTELCKEVTKRYHGLKYASLAGWIEAAKSLRHRWGPDVEPLPHLRPRTVLTTSFDDTVVWHVSKYTFGRYKLDVDETYIGVMLRYAHPAHIDRLPPTEKTQFGTLRAARCKGSGTHRLISSLYFTFDE